MHVKIEVRTELWPLSRFVEYAGNPRNNDGAVGRMSASIREFGFKIPCLVRSDGELVNCPGDTYSMIKTSL